MKRASRIALQLTVSGAVLAFLVLQIDARRMVDLIASSNAAYVAAALAILLATTWVMAWRWQLLLASKGIDEPLAWLTKLYFVGYAASHVLPSSVGGDAVRIVEHARRRPQARGEAAGAVLMERVLGASGTLLLLLVGLALTLGRYEELRLLGPSQLLVVAAPIAIVALLLFSRRIALQLQQRVFPLARRIRLERPLQSVYAAVHGYRDRPALLGLVLGVTVATQLARVAAIWLCAEAVGVELSPLVYVVFASLLTLVTIVPFTLNGLGVREAFFVAFLARFGIEHDAALATGLLFYAIILAESLPGALVLLWHAALHAFVRPRVQSPS